MNTPFIARRVPCPIYPGRKALLAPARGLLARIAVRTPMWVPVYVVGARVEYDTATWVHIGLCRNRDFNR